MTDSKQNFFKAGKKLSRILGQVLAEVKPGKKLIELENLTQRLIAEAGGVPNFAMEPNYHWATCINLNEGIVHGIPDEKVIKENDVVSLDMGLRYHGWHSDMAYTLQVKSQNSTRLPAPKAAGSGGQDIKSQKNLETGRFLETGKRALAEAIKTVKAGNRVGHISAAIERVIEGAGYHCARELTGHGIGRKLHQEPWIPGLLTRPVEKTPLLKKGMGLAIEVIYTMGKPRLEKSADGWTIKTVDGRISALFEKTVLVTEGGVRIVTPFGWRG